MFVGIYIYTHTTFTNGYTYGTGTRLILFCNLLFSLNKHLKFFMLTKIFFPFTFTDLLVCGSGTLTSSPVPSKLLSLIKYNPVVLYDDVHLYNSIYYTCHSAAWFFISGFALHLCFFMSSLLVLSPCYMALHNVHPPHFSCWRSQ